MNFLQRLINDTDTVPALPDGGVILAPEKTVRIAIYDSARAAPRIVDLHGEDYGDFINLLSTKTYKFSQEKGGSIPFTLIKELIENLIHAFFKEVIISIFEDGNRIRVSDQGPGIIDINRSLQPGFTTASADMKRYIKGVGSGLPIVKETLDVLGGELEIDSNLSAGTVVTLSLKGRPNKDASLADYQSKPSGNALSEFDAGLMTIFSDRQKRVLSLIAEMGSVGPSKIAEELDISLSTSHRDLTILEEYQLIRADDHGRRSLTSKGINFMSSLTG